MRRVASGLLDPAGVERVCAPRTAVVLEGRPAWDGRRCRFDQADGPLAAYRRTVELGPPGPDGRVPVRQEVTLRAGLALASLLVAPLARRSLGRLDPPPGPPWWAPPGRLDRRQAVTVAALCGLSVLAGYLGGLLPATITFAGREWHVGDAGQGAALAAVQAGTVLSLAVLALADRAGRRRWAVAATVAGSLVSALGAASPSLPALAADQVVVAALLGAQYVLLGVMAVEAMPDRSRAWALALVTMSFGLGGGVTLLVLPLAGLGTAGWRWPYALGALAAPCAVALGRHLPETLVRHAARHHRHGPPLRGVARRRLLVVGAGTLLLALFAVPAAQFQNQYLRAQRHWTATRISLVEQAVGTVGGLGTLVGGHFADTRGRRPVAAVAIAAGTAATLLSYLSGGAAFAGWATVASGCAYAAAPALGVYGAELFPARLRARAGGVLTVLGAAGGAVGLAVTGAVASLVGTIAPALAVLAIGPALLVVLLAVAYPETAGRSLTELNPGDDPEAQG